MGFAKSLILLYLIKCMAIVLLCAGCFFSCTKRDEALNSNQLFECDCKNELYTYSVLSGQKNYLYDRLLNNWLHVGFSHQAQDIEIVRYINKTGFFKPVDIHHIRKMPEELRIEVEAGINGSIDNKRLYVSTKKQMTCSQLKEIICSLEESSIVVYANLAFWYWTNDNKKKKDMESFSNYFHVKVKDKDDLSALYSFSHETNTFILEQPEYLSFSRDFTLRVDNSSKGNALQMANYFAESGKFALAAAEWLDGLKPMLSH